MNNYIEVNSFLLGVCFPSGHGVKVIVIALNYAYYFLVILSPENTGCVHYNPKPPVSLCLFLQPSTELVFHSSNFSNGWAKTASLLLISSCTTTCITLNLIMRPNQQQPWPHSSCIVGECDGKSWMYLIY